jgi:hypothetical protein
LKEEGTGRILLAFAGFCVFYALFFSPVFFRGRVFISDGQLAAFYSHLTLWSDDLAGGWPAAADLTQMMFSPLRHLFRHLPSGFNLFVASSYVLASTFMFGYVHAITKSHFAGIVSGLVLGLSGFMMAHLAHTGMIAGVAWMPLLLLALHRLRDGCEARWLGLGTFAVCAMMLSGHPQITVYSYLLAAAYALALGFEPQPGRWRYWVTVLVLFVLGAGLSALQWMPTYELSKETFRDNFSYEDFTAFSLPIRQLAMLIFPFFYGPQRGHFFGTAYWGEWNFAELSGFAGIVGLSLAAIALLARRDRVRIFWGAVAVGAVLLALGGSLPWLAHLVYRVPVLNQFRVPGRHVYEYVLAISVLSGLGVAALQRGEISPEALKKTVRAGAGLFAVMVMVAVTLYSREAPVEQHSPGTLSFLSVRLPAAIYLPMLWMVSCILVLNLYRKGRLGRFGEWSLVLLVGLEMSTSGWFHEWRNSGFGAAPLWHPEMVQNYWRQAGESGQKLISQKSAAIPLDSARLAGIRTLSWYGPLMMRRFSEATGIDSSGMLQPAALAADQVGLDVFAGRFLFAEALKTVDSHGIRWNRDPLRLQIGNGCNSGQAGVRVVGLPAPVMADRLAVVSRLGCSTAFKDGQPVADVVLRRTDGGTETVALRAGVDTAEWAIDCQDVVPLMQHRRAAIFDSWRAERAGVPPCQGHSYLGQLAFGRGKIAALEFRARDGVSLDVISLTLLDESTGSANVLDTATPPERWKFLQDTDGVSVYENRRAMPAAWLVFDVIPVAPAQSLAALHTSKLPDGSPFDPAKQALVENNIASNRMNANAKGMATVLRHSDATWEIGANSTSPGLLVIAQNFYPGWRATVNGVQSEILRVNYAQQGVLLPAGESRILLEFRPVSFMAGVSVSGLSLIVLAYLIWRTRRRTPR